VLVFHDCGCIWGVVVDCLCVCDGGGIHVDVCVVGDVDVSIVTIGDGGIVTWCVDGGCYVVTDIGFVCVLGGCIAT